jgi:hypothetical protein
VFSCTSFVTSWQVEFLSGIGASHFHSVRVVGLVGCNRTVTATLDTRRTE